MAAVVMAIRNRKSIDRGKRNRALDEDEDDLDDEANEKVVVPASTSQALDKNVDKEAPADPTPCCDMPGTACDVGRQCPVDDTLPFQAGVKQIYMNGFVQGFVAMLIVLNFLFTIAEKEIDPFAEDDKRYKDLWIIVDQIFTWCFVVELVMNMYGSWLCPFWQSGWNIFDFVIVAISVLASTGALQGPFAMLKTLRAFRVFRLFKRVPALNKIINSLLRSIPGVMNAFIIMVIVMSIYAIIGVELFSTFGGCVHGGCEEVYYTVQQVGVEPWAHYPNSTISSVTARGFYYGQEYFGTFMRALFTLFQVLTGESWAEVVARPLMFGYPSNSSWVITSFYFSSYIVVMQIVLVNVVVAVLLDKFVEEDPKKEEEEKAVAEIAELAAPSSAPSPSAATASSDGFTRRLSSSVPTATRAEMKESYEQLRDELTSVHAKLDDMSKMKGQLDALAKALESMAAPTRSAAAVSAVPALPRLDGRLPDGSDGYQA